jgi:hypothetical protein
MTPDPHFDSDTALEVVHGLRPKSEVAGALEHARACPACDRHLREAAGDRERYRARQAETLGAAGSPAARRGSFRRRVGLIGFGAVAAVLAVVATSLLLRTPAPTSSVSTQLRLPLASELVRLRTPGEETDLPRLEAAMALYDRGDFGLVATRLEQPFASSRLEPLRHLYRASALLELNRTSEASEELGPVAGVTLPSPYADWREWALLHLSANPADAARGDSTLRALATRPGPLQAPARAALRARTPPADEPAP